MSTPCDHRSDHGNRGDDTQVASDSGPQAGERGVPRCKTCLSPHNNNERRLQILEPEKEERKLKILRDLVAQCRSSVHRRPSAIEIRDKLQRLL